MHRSRGSLALWLILFTALAASLGLWWKSTRRPEFNFLPRLASAAWIVYPTPPDVNTHLDPELPTLFKTSFELQTVPAQARLRIAGFHRYSLAINGTTTNLPVQPAKNWKQPDVFEVADQLRPGTNRIDVTVYNSTGPPALWLSLDDGILRTGSGQNWQASYAGAVWRDAVPASRSKVTPTGGWIYRLPKPWTSLLSRWPILLAFALLSAAGGWVMSKIGGRLNIGADDTIPSSSSSSSSSNPVLSVPMTRAKTRMESIVSICRRIHLGEILPVAVLIGCWAALFANNLGALPYMVGNDVDGHMGYIRYIQEHRSLPLASQGWEMFQPPLYYVLSAACLNLLHLSVSEVSGITALRLLGLGIGIAHFTIVWATLRLLFPAQRSKALWGVGLAACLPPLLYLSQYVTNEAFAAALVSGCVLLCLRGLKQERMSWGQCAGLGVCLGAALLAKSTALLALPMIGGALIWRWLEKGTLTVAQWVGRLGLILVVCMVVSGWHYARLWMHYGNPLIGVWDPRLGFHWWQDDGYRTSAFYLRFGDVLVHPWAGAWKSFGDGIYSTLWGDGLLGSAADFLSRPPWNYELMATGYWLALLPTLAIVVGTGLALFNFIRQPSAEWFLMLGCGFLVALAMVYMSLAVPYYCMVKAFYGLSALIPFCAVGALGLDWMARRSAKLRFLVCLVFGVWAINSYASFWIWRLSVPACIERAKARIEQGHDLEAAEVLKRALTFEPRNADLRFALAFVLTMSGHDAEGMKEAEVLVQDHPDDCRGHHVLALARAHQRRVQEAIDEVRRVMVLNPGYDPDWENFATLLMLRRQHEETVKLARQALGTAPFSAGLRVALGYALLFEGHDNEASAQFQYACALNSNSADSLINFAWTLATSGDAGERNGAVAVKLAEQACALTGYRQTAGLGTLAAAYAEAGRYDEAVKAAERARASAMASGDSVLAAKIQGLIDLFKTGQPYREPK